MRHFSRAFEIILSGRRQRPVRFLGGVQFSESHFLQGVLLSIFQYSNTTKSDPEPPGEEPQDRRAAARFFISIFKASSIKPTTALGRGKQGKFHIRGQSAEIWADWECIFVASIARTARDEESAEIEEREREKKANILVPTVATSTSNEGSRGISDSSIINGHFSSLHTYSNFTFASFLID